MTLPETALAFARDCLRWKEAYFPKGMGIIRSSDDGGANGISFKFTDMNSVFRAALRYYIAHKSPALKERLSEAWSDWLEEAISPEQFTERLMSICVENARGRKERTA